MECNDLGLTPADIVEGTVIILEAAALPLRTEWVRPTLAQGCARLVHNPRIPPGFDGC